MISFLVYFIISSPISGLAVEVIDDGECMLEQFEGEDGDHRRHLFQDIANAVITPVAVSVAAG